MTLSQYLDNLNRRYQTGISREHSYRGDLQTLLETIVPDALVTNEPQRIACGAPDYILTRKDIPVGYIEAKDLNAELGYKGFKEQFDRYKASLSNLIFTNYLDFHLYRDGVFVTSISLGEVSSGRISHLSQNFSSFTNLIKDFSLHIGQTIRSPRKLAEMMAAKARLLSEVIERALNSDESNDSDSTLKDQMRGFQQILIHDIKPKEFADIYAQTIAYGMFAARLHDPTLPTFSRQEAAELIPKTNPFLRKLFGYIAGPDIDERMLWIVDGLADIFRATDIAQLLKNFGAATQTQDPIIHFYETFLSEYDPKLRKARGVWYTPEPVVNFIVRAVDDILKTEFKLPDGLADTTKIKIKTKQAFKATADMRSKLKEIEVEQEVHKVQILDPATGTGTFLAEVVKQIHSRFAGQQGIWSNYVENHLIPRLNGFELLMASYAMAHLKLDLLLTETGYKPKKEQRFKIFLTNSLEEHHPDAGTLFANWLSDEANEANRIKRDTPVMVVLGNPPYSGESANKGEWIMKLMEDYKKEPGGKEKLKEQNSKFINDDYVKFLRYAQYFIEKNGEGIVAFINPHGYLDNPTFRGMRWNLLKTYDTIYTINLHGNTKKKEVAPDGSVDENIFDIQQGVSVNIFIKTGKKKDSELSKVYHYDTFGKREHKYDFLFKNTIKTIAFKELMNLEPDYFFVQKSFDKLKVYEQGFAVNKLFNESSLGILTKRDNLSIDYNENLLYNKIEHFLDVSKTTVEVCTYFNLVVKDNDKWDANITRQRVSKTDIKNSIKNCVYRPFDNRKVLYNHYFVARPNMRILNHLTKDNKALIIGRQGQAVGGDEWNVMFITSDLTDQNIFRRGGGTIFPLYFYTENSTQQSFDQQPQRTPNLNMEIVAKISDSINHGFIPDENILSETPGDKAGCFSPLNLLDYIYAVLHSPTYREKYKEFLKIDFPRVPYPKDASTFGQLVALGGELRSIHLLESPVVNTYITQYPVDGDNIVGKVKYEAGKVYINNTQYFDAVPPIAWSFYIGGYQPAQKWLKDRKDRELSFEDILHYQKIIVALTETDRLMKEIDTIEIGQV